MGQFWESPSNPIFWHERQHCSRLWFRCNMLKYAIFTTFIDARGLEYCWESRGTFLGKSFQPNFLAQAPALQSVIIKNFLDHCFSKPTISILPNQTKPTKANVLNQTYKTKCTKPNLRNQTYQTKPNKPNLINQTYQTKPTKPNLANQTYQTKPNLPNQTYQTKPT